MPGPVDECSVAVSKARDQMIRDGLADHMQIIMWTDPTNGLYHEDLMIDNVLAANLVYGLHKDGQFKVLYNKVTPNTGPVVCVLECPKCHTKYAVETEAITCGDCGTVLRKQAILGEHLTEVRMKKTYKPIVPRLDPTGGVSFD